MGNDQNKHQPKLSTSPASPKPNSVTATNNPRLSQAFAAYVSFGEANKSSLLKQDFTDQIFIAIPEVGKLIFNYLSLLQSVSKEHSTGTVEKKVYLTGAEKILAINSDEDLTNFYARLVSKGKDIITSEEVFCLLSLSQQASWLSAGINLRPTEEWNQSFESAVKNLFAENTSMVTSAICSWCLRVFPKLTVNLHSYVCSGLVGDKKSFVVTAEIPSNLVQLIKDGHSLASTSTLWLLASVLPSTYFPDSTSSCLLPLSNIAKVVQKEIWHKLYDSNSQGLSVNRFQHHVLEYSGPTVMFLSFDIYVYAVAVGAHWKESVNRWGGVDGMFLEIQPNFRLIQNGDDFVYLNLSNRAAPKGLHLGKGGQSTFLKIDDELNKVNHYGVNYKLKAIEVWGCGGQEVLERQRQIHQWEKKEVTKQQNRKLVPDDWKNNPDKEILDMAGVTTEHSQRGDI